MNCDCRIWRKSHRFCFFLQIKVNTENKCVSSCHNFADMFTALTRVLPNYCATYLPIILVMVINPVLYHNASHTIDMEGANGHVRHTS